KNILNIDIENIDNFYYIDLILSYLNSLIVITQFSSELDEYKNRETAEFPYETMVALRLQLKSWLAKINTAVQIEEDENVNEDEKKKEPVVYPYITFGFLTPLWVINHYPHRTKGSPGYIDPRTCYDGRKTFDKWYNYIKIITSMTLKWLRYSEGGQFASRQIGRQQSFLFPGPLQVLIQSMIDGDQSFLPILKYVTYLPDIAFLAYLECRLNAPWNSIAKDLRAYVDTKGNWATAQYWEKTDIKKEREAAPHVQIVKVPLSFAIAYYEGEVGRLRLYTKLAGTGEKHLVAIMVDEYMYGFNLLFYDKRNWHFGEKEFAVWNRFFEKHGLVTAKDETAEAIYAALRANHQHLVRKVLCFLDVARCVDPASTSVKTFVEVHGSFDKSLVFIL
ncbi:MAG: hypothetical protein ACPG2Y_02750, partial [Acholeplasmataceae bacterium]